MHAGFCRVVSCRVVPYKVNRSSLVCLALYLHPNWILGQHNLLSSTCQELLRRAYVVSGTFDCIKIQKYKILKPFLMPEFSD
jgi:hypothetical protein